MQAFYYAMPTLAVIVVGLYVFASIKLHKFIWFSPIVYLALIGSVGLWIKIGTNIFSASEQGVFGLLVLEDILLEGIIEEYKYQKQNMTRDEE
ncbi:hypothetical protein EFP49_05540 [Lactobacillus johnsonii]|uniref:hypothetical protein n=1 Tax=Lactobacillus johnsonii TaxID=33959 RepID=UPI0021A3A562|nr:hypothetical protein [Lactobacillus johnsonii]MCT3342260.1 hypothetical protein [Lactobacillus johnsonii]